jgi:DNA polymerase III alpha subunit
VTGGSVGVRLCCLGESQFKMRTPKKYVNLHAHSNGSIGDAISLPQEHFDFARQNQLDAHAITDHGNMNTFSHSYKYFEELKKKGNSTFKVLYGNEAYFIPSIEDWEKQKAEKAVMMQQAKLEKAAAKTKKASSAKDVAELIVFAHDEKTIEELEEQQAIVNITEDKDGQENVAVVEDEEETKTAKKPADPLRKRNHLVLLAKNEAGLKSLFKLTSLSYRDGFYYYPRLDFKMLKEHSRGNIIGSSACLGGSLSSIMFNNVNELNLSKQEIALDYRKVFEHNYSTTQKELEEMAWKFVEVFGGTENFYLEIQFNRISYQHLINRHLIDLSRKTGIKLIATADCHYPDPNVWKERSIYKAMSWMTQNKTLDFDLSGIPQTIEELEYELYPKNSDQMWQAYQKYCVQECSPLYDSDEIHDLVCDSIERTHDIAHDLVTKTISYDRTPKLPSLDKLVDKSKIEAAKLEGLTEDDVSFNELVDEVTKGLESKNLLENQVYVDRALEELDVIRHLKLPKYFLTCSKSLKLIGSKMLLGAGRGCFLPGTVIKTPYQTKDKRIEDVKVGDYVYARDGTVNEVVNKPEYEIDEEVVCIEFDDGSIIKCTKDHKFFTSNRGLVEAQYLTVDDDLIKVA